MIPAETQPMSMSEATVERDPTEARTFPLLIAGLEDGRLSDELSEQVREIVARLHDTARDVGGKPAAVLTLTIGFKLDDGMIEVRADHKAKMPKVVRPRSMYFATPNNNLTGRNPKQRELPLRSVGLEVGAVRTV